MNKKNKWVQDFVGMNASEQLEISSLIKRELISNEVLIDDKNYNKKESLSLRNFFDKLSKYINENRELYDYNSLFVKFNMLDDDNKKVILDEIKYVLNNYNYSCDDDGHVFSNWIKNDDVYERTCSICGFKQVEEYEPLSYKVKEYIKTRRKKY